MEVQPKKLQQASAECQSLVQSWALAALAPAPAQHLLNSPATRTVVIVRLFTCVKQGIDFDLYILVLVFPSCPNLRLANRMNLEGKPVPPPAAPPSKK